MLNFRTFLEREEVFKLLIQTAEVLNVKTYLIGGFVRDLLLKRPCKDIDIVCVGSGIEFANMFVILTRENLKVTEYKNFGTAMVNYENYTLEFVGARKESYRANSRKPSVENGTLEDDQKRRDFTINALGISLNSDTLGELIDPFNGLADLHNKILITPLEPNLTFTDDPLRMLRAIRFATQLSFEINPKTFKAIKDNRNRLKIISQERIRDELNKIILSPKPSYGFKLLLATQILELIFPELLALKGVEVIDNKKHKDNFYHTLQVLDNIAATTDDLYLRWSAILHDIAKPATKRFQPAIGWTFHGHEDLGSRMVPRIFKRFRLPLNHKMRFVQKMVAMHLRPIVLAQSEVTESAIRRLAAEAGEDLEALFKLCRADITSKNPAKVKKYLHNFDLVEAKIKHVAEKDKLRNFQPPITGDIIMNTFDLKPSKTVGELKIKIRRAILDGIIPNDYRACFEYMLELGEKMGLQVKNSDLSKTEL